MGRTPASGSRHARWAGWLWPLAAAAGLVLAVLPALWPGAWPAGMGAPGLGAWLWLTVVSVAALAAWAGWQAGRQARREELRRAAADRQALEELAPQWLWRSNADHQLQLWRPPPGAAEGDWTGGPPSPLWLGFETRQAGQGSLEARLRTGTRLQGLRVWRRDAPQQGAWLLAALPQQDEEGRFAGHLGSLQPVGAEELCHADQAWLQALWPAAGLPALGLVAVHAEAAPGQPAGHSWWRIERATPEGQALLGLGPQPASWPGWLEVQDRLPAPLVPVLAELLADAGALVSRQAGDWNVSMLALPAGADQGERRLLLLRPKPTVPADASQDQELAAERDSFVYSISHDLRAPLRVVDGFARILKEDYARYLDRVGNDHLDRVAAAAARMGSMIEALLSLSRLQSQALQRRPVNLSQLATFIMEELQREAPERKVRLDIEPGLTVQGDPTLLRMALENLLGNAWKYSARREVTEISLRREEQDGRPVLVVADNGAGFDMRFADRLFGVFQRLHSPKDFAGTGVGLASVKRIVRRHGGDIWAESAPDEGARFYFTLGEHTG
ncbi:sensor histidine kinase [Ideonella livida]|uniref:histidine kinase n=1 Tax=Ideonella livida TaxID=2707176 RepID=A0A7C9TI25_9BURK|nr:ATP-binding protein [Ideonella livida]NDY89943.1 hypothetical protein [Ideonella livida]